MKPAAQQQVPCPPVALRVRDLTASRAFFEELFGLVPASAPTSSSGSVCLVSPVPHPRQFAILLTTDPVRVRLSGVHIELENPNDLLDIYFLALLSGFRTHELRFRRGSLATTILDPDGHLIEVEAHSPLSQAGLPGRRAWRETYAVPGRGAAAEDWEYRRAGQTDNARERSVASLGARRRDEKRPRSHPSVRPERRD